MSLVDILKSFGSKPEYKISAYNIGLAVKAIWNANEMTVLYSGMANKKFEQSHRLMHMRSMALKIVSTALSFPSESTGIDETQAGVMLIAQINKKSMLEISTSCAGYAKEFGHLAISIIAILSDDYFASNPVGAIDANDDSPYLQSCIQHIMVMLYVLIPMYIVGARVDGTIETSIIIQHIEHGMRRAIEVGLPQQKISEVGGHFINLLSMQHPTTTLSIYINMVRSSIQSIASAAMAKTEVPGIIELGADIYQKEFIMDSYLKKTFNIEIASSKMQKLSKILQKELTTKNSDKLLQYGIQSTMQNMFAPPGNTQMYGGYSHPLVPQVGASYGAGLNVGYPQMQGTYPNVAQLQGPTHTGYNTMPQGYSTVIPFGTYNTTGGFPPMTGISGQTSAPNYYAAHSQVPQYFQGASTTFPLHGAQSIMGVGLPGRM